MSKRWNINWVYDFVFTPRHPADRQSLTNPIQHDRIGPESELPLELVAPRVDVRESFVSFTRTAWIPFLAILWYAYLIVPHRDKGWHYITSEAVGFLVGCVLFVICYPVTRFWLHRIPVLSLSALVLLPTYFAFDSIYVRLLIAFLAAIAFADVLARQSLWLGTGFPVSRNVRIAVRRAWHQRLLPAARQIPGLEWYWLSVSLVLVLPLTIIFANPLQFDVAVPGLRHFLIGLAILIASPWIIELAVAFVYHRKPLGFLQMVRCYNQALFEWFTYRVEAGATPGVILPFAGPTLVRRRLFFGIIILLITAITPIHIYFKDYFVTWQLNRENGLVLSNAPTKSERNGPPPIASNAGNPLALQPYQIQMYERMNEQQRKAFIDRRLGERTDSGTEEFAQVATVETIVPRDDYLTRRNLEMLPAVIRDKLVQYGPFILSVVSPFLFFYAIGFAVAGRCTAMYPVRRKNEIIGDTLRHSTWNQFVQELGQHHHTRHSLFLGLNALDNAPIVVPREVFQEHAHLLGDTGSGKTSLGLSPMIAQLIRMKDLSVVVIDMKGDDQSLMLGTKLEAENAGLRFRWFSNEPDKPTFAFNPLTQKDFQTLSVHQQADILLNSLGLQYGTEYGKSYFSDANSQLLLHALRAKPAPRSFMELAAVLRNPSNFAQLSQAIKRDSSHLPAVVERLAAFAPLNILPDGKISHDVLDQAINFEAIFHTPQVLYFHLSAPLGTATSAETARLALYSMLTAAKAAAHPRTQVILFIDEFQRIIAKNLEFFLQAARSFNIGVVLANQSLADLKTPEFDLASAVKANCRFKQYFSVSDIKDISELTNVAGQTVVHNLSVSPANYMPGYTGGRTPYQSVSFTEQVIPRLSVNQILLAGDHPRQSIVHLRRGAGTAQFGGFPFILAGTHYISKQEYERRKFAPWPQIVPGTMIPADHQQSIEFAETGTPLFQSPLLVDPEAQSSSPPPGPHHWRKKQKKLKLSQSEKGT